MSEPIDVQEGKATASEPEFPQANAVAVKAIAGALASTLGPTPSDKLVVESLATRQETRRGDVSIDEFVITSDGATLLEHLPLEHPVAPIVERMVGPERPGETDVQGEDIPDGVTTSVVLAAALLDEAIELIERGVHPQSVVRGYDTARQLAVETVVKEARRLESFDDPHAAATAVAETAMTGNDVGGIANRLAVFARESVSEVGYPTEKTLAVRQICDGSLDDSRLIRGAVLDRNSRVKEAMPERVEDANVLVLGGHDRGGLNVPNLDDEMTATVENLDEIDDFEAVFETWRAEVCASIREADVDVVVTELGIDQQFMSFLVENDIVGVRAVNRLDLAQLARATGATVVKHPRDIATEHLGQAGLVAEQDIEPRKGRRKRRRMMVFDNCPDPESVCVLLRGANDYLGEQATIGVRKAAAAVATAQGDGDHVDGVVPGGGGIDVSVASAVRNASAAEGSRAALAMDAFADAVEQIPYTLARNAGRDPIKTLADLRTAHEHDDNVGLVFPEGDIDDVDKAGIFDPAATRLDGYNTATDVATLLLRIDDALDAEFTEDEPNTDDIIYDDAAEKQEEFLADK